jgi:hypothetical protein
VDTASTSDEHIQYGAVSAKADDAALFQNGVNATPEEVSYRTCARELSFLSQVLGVLRTWSYETHVEQITLLGMVMTLPGGITKTLRDKYPGVAVHSILS